MKKIFTLLSLLAATGAANAQYVQNTGMESWKSYSAGLPPTSLERPDNWYGTDSLIHAFKILLGPGTYSKQIFKSTDSHSGSFAAKLVTAEQGPFGATSAIMTNTSINIDLSDSSFTMEGGTPVNARIDHVSAWVKYIPQGLDSGAISIQAVLAGAGVDGDSIVGYGGAMFGAKSSYTQIDMPIDYFNPTVVPDRLQIVFLSSGADSTTTGTELYVDDVIATVFPTGVTIPLMGGNAFNCYPNPASGSINISTQNAGIYTWQAYTLSGQLVAGKNFEGKTTADISKLSAGMYFYTITDNAGTIVKRDKFSVQQ